MLVAWNIWIFDEVNNNIIITTRLSLKVHFQQWSMLQSAQQLILFLYGLLLISQILIPMEYVLVSFLLDRSKTSTTLIISKFSRLFIFMNSLLSSFFNQRCYRFGLRWNVFFSRFSKKCYSYQILTEQPLVKVQSIVKKQIVWCIVNHIFCGVFSTAHLIGNLTINSLEIKPWNASKRQVLFECRVFSLSEK